MSQGKYYKEDNEKEVNENWQNKGNTPENSSSFLYNEE